MGEAEEILNRLKKLEEQQNSFHIQHIRFEAHFTSELGNFTRQLEGFTKSVEGLVITMKEVMEWKNVEKGKDIVNNRVIAVLCTIIAGLIIWLITKK